jgi:hypothetical protein
LGPRPSQNMFKKSLIIPFATVIAITMVASENQVIVLKCCF